MTSVASFMAAGPLCSTRAFAMFARKPDTRSVPGRHVGLRLKPERVPRGLLVRTFVLGVLAILGAAWGLARHLTASPPPMLVPRAPRPAPTYDADAGELPVPEWFESAPGAPRTP
jgi:hypothetical protein